MSICAIVAASPEFNLEHLQSLPYDYLMAVDGGFAYLEDAGINPDVVLGDFDSLGKDPKHMRVSRFPCDKDFSDLDGALERALYRGYDEIYVYAALGGRLDHTLNNLQALAAVAEEGPRIYAVGVNEMLCVLVGPDVYEPQDLPEEGTVSLIAMTPKLDGIILEDLKYTLDEAYATNRKTWGLSNELIGLDPCIALASGTVLVFHPLPSRASEKLEDCGGL